MTTRPFSRWFRDLIHLNRGLHASVDFLLFEGILQSQRVDHGGQHSHVIGGNAVHVSSLVGHATEEIAAAHDDRELNSQFVHVREFGSDLMDARRVHAKTLIGSKSFSGEFEQNALEGRSSHKVAPASRRLSRGCPAHAQAKKKTPIRGA